jgi:exodeoxyribonuclease VII large subunit
MEHGPHIFTVREVTRYVKTLLERERTLQGMLVRGEISNLKYHSSGHVYFTLKDDASELRCTLWRDRALALGFRLDEGMKVVVEGSITVYERSGQYQMNVYSVQAEGVGNLYLAFEQLKRKLELEGLFDRDRKRPLPFLPRRIALLSSPTGAVVHDFITVATRRWRGRHIILVPTAVQGAAAPASIVRSLAMAARIPGVEVIVLARGGGSFEDLACFNDEAVARAIAHSPLPVVSAVGHETDFTIADFVADLRAPTPSAAAELVVPDLQGADDALSALQRRIVARVRGRLHHARADLERTLRHPALRRPRTIIDDRAQTLDLLADRIAERMKTRLQRAGQALAAVDGRIAALDPRGVLLRGYALVTRPDGSLVPSAALAGPEPALDIQFFDGTVRVTPTGDPDA